MTCAALAIDTYDIAEKLERAGIQPEHAKAISLVVRHSNNVAIK